MKIFKNGMRVWITLASVSSFLFAWVLFGHSDKPLPLQFNLPTTTTVTQPEPGLRREFSNDEQSQFFPFSQQSQSSFFRPRFRTGGS
jgi:hypothetical protein